MGRFSAPSRAGTGPIPGPAVIFADPRSRTRDPGISRKNPAFRPRGEARARVRREIFPWVWGKKGIFPPLILFRRFPAYPGEFPTVSLNPFKSSPDLFRFVSYLIRSCLILFLRLTVCSDSLWLALSCLAGDFDRLFFDPRRVLNPGRERIFGASYRLDQFAVVKSGDGARVARRNGPCFAHLPRNFTFC